MAKKAEAFKQYNQAAIASMIVERMPELVSAMAQPMSKIGNLTVLTTDGSSTGASKITNELLNVAAQSMTMIKGLTGFDLSAALQSGNDSTKPLGSNAQLIQASAKAENGEGS